MIKYRDSYNSSPALESMRSLHDTPALSHREPCVDDICQRQSERVYRTVGHFHRTYYRRIHRRFYQPRLIQGSITCASIPAARHDSTNGFDMKGRLPEEINKPPVFLYAMACYLPENHILFTFWLPIPIGHCITAPLASNVVSSGSSKKSKRSPQNAHSRFHFATAK